MNILRNPELMDRLCSEYVLGTLRGGARRRFEVLLHDSDALQRMVAQWQDRLHPMAELSTPVAPPAHVWSSIERRLGLKPSRETVVARKRAFWLGLREDLGFWRGLGMVSTTCALILLSVLLSRQVEPVIPPTQIMSTVAMLLDERAKPFAIVTTVAATGQMTVKMIEPQPIADDKSLELWAIPKEGAPRSLGLVTASGSVMLPVPEDANPRNTPVLAVSLEPKGGSPTKNAPTGPVLWKGVWVPV